MGKEYCSNINDLFDIFEEAVSACDVLSAKVLSQISSAIAKCRVEMGMTQKEFAKYMEVSQGMVSKWESEDYNFSVKTLADIAAKLDMDLNIYLQKTSIVQTGEEVWQFSHFTAIENRPFLINNENRRQKLQGCAVRYVPKQDTLKIMVK